jgi:hypothetical protein
MNLKTFQIMLLTSEGNTMEIKLMTGHFMSILCTNKTKIKLQLYSVNLLQTNEVRNVKIQRMN